MTRGTADDKGEKREKERQRKTRGTRKDKRDTRRPGRQEMTRETSDDKRRPRQVHRQRTVPIKKRAGQRPAPQETREAPDDKRDNK